MHEFRFHVIFKFQLESVQKFLNQQNKKKAHSKIRRFKLLSFKTKPAPVLAPVLRTPQAEALKQQVRTASVCIVHFHEKNIAHIQPSNSAVKCNFSKPFENVLELGSTVHVLYTETCCRIVNIEFLCADRRTT